MARTYSNMLALGTTAPHFTLTDTISGKEMSLQTLKGAKGTVVMFICNHCPFVIHIIEGLVKIALDYQSKGVSFIAISSNDIVNFPNDSPQLMKENALENNFTFPYLYDETQEVAKLYDAACTPDIYLFDADLKLVYRGQIDDSRPQNGIPVTGVDLRYALDCLLENKPNHCPQKPSMGCNIKWKE